MMDITYKELELEVEADYTPEEPMVMYYPDGSGHPGSAAECDILSIKYKGNDVYGIFEKLDLISEIEELYINKMVDE